MKTGVNYGAKEQKNIMSTNNNNNTPNHIRPLALCLFRNKGRILVNGDADPHSQEYYYRPLGGGIEFGELSEAAIKREIMEELGESIENVQFVGVLENVFTSSKSSSPRYFFNSL